MAKQAKHASLADTLLGWGFVLAFAVIVGAGGYEAFKIVALVPGAFESSPAVWRGPMGASEEDYQPTQPGQRRMTPRQRARNRDWAEQQER